MSQTYSLIAHKNINQVCVEYDWSSPIEISTTLPPIKNNLDVYSENYSPKIQKGNRQMLGNLGLNSEHRYSLKTKNTKKLSKRLLGFYLIFDRVSPPFLQIEDISIFNNLKYLEKLEICHISLRDNQIKTIDSLGNFEENKNLDHLFLDLGINKLTSVDVLRTIEKLLDLRYLCLNFENNQIKDISFMDEFQSLKSLVELKISLKDTLVEDVSIMNFIKDLKCLETLNVGIKTQTYENRQAFILGKPKIVE